jgi:hypothetical protein
MAEGNPMRFSIRDLMWMTLVVALSLGWWFSLKANDAKHDLALQQIEAKRTATVRHAQRLWTALSSTFALTASTRTV